MLVIMLVNKHAWERSHVPVEAKRTKVEKYAGFAANFLWLLALGYSVFLPLRFGTIWFYIGFLVFIIGLTLLTVATFDFMTTPVDQLTARGAYRFSRHPMYVATFFICLGAGIATLSWLFIFISVGMAFCFYQETLVEEKSCLDRYGDAYKEYIHRTPRLIGVPKFGG